MLGAFVPEVARFKALVRVQVLGVLPHNLGVVRVRGRGAAVRGAHALRQAEMRRGARRRLHAELADDAGEASLNRGGVGNPRPRPRAVPGRALPAALALARAPLALVLRRGGRAVRADGELGARRAERQGLARFRFRLIPGRGGVARSGAGRGRVRDEPRDASPHLRLRGVHRGLALADALDVPRQGIRPAAHGGGLDHANLLLRGERDAGQKREAQLGRGAIGGRVPAGRREVHRAHPLDPSVGRAERARVRRGLAAADRAARGFSWNASPHSFHRATAHAGGLFQTRVGCLVSKRARADLFRGLAHPATLDDAPASSPRLFLVSSGEMNSPQAKLKRARDAEVKEATDLKKFKADLLSKVIVKTIVKEQTNTQSVTALRFNHLPFASGTSAKGKPEDTNLGNLFATCGGDFATVYDDEHFGDHVAVVAQFKNEKTKHSAGGELTAVAWVDARGFTGHEFGDALLAVGGGNDNAVQIFSVAEARVVRMLKGHVGSIVALAAGAAGDADAADAKNVGGSRLAVLDSNGTVTVWNWRTAQVVCAFKAGDAIAVEMPDEGDVVITGHADGDVVVWPVAGEENAEAFEKKKKRADMRGAMAGTVGNVKALARDETKPAAVTVNLAGAHTGVAVDCVRCLPGDRLATKSVDGVVCVRGVRSSPASSAAATTWKVPGCAKPKKHELRSSLSSFGCDPLGEFLAVGNSDGETFVYDVATGLAIKTVKQDRDFKGLNAVRAAAVSRDCRHVHAAFGPGVVWRAEVVPGLDDEEGPGTPEEA